MKITLAVEDKMPPHRVEHCAVTVDPQGYVAWAQVLLSDKNTTALTMQMKSHLECAVFYKIYVRLPNVCMMVNPIKVCISARKHGDIVWQENMNI